MGKIRILLGATALLLSSYANSAVYEFIKIAEINSSFRLVTSPSINDAGMVVFRAGLTAGGESIDNAGNYQ